MDKAAQFEILKSRILENINTWADLYEFFDEVMLRVKQTMEPSRVFDALFMMYGFFHAMRELPEEGDIKKLVERMLYILIYESETKLGVSVSVLSVEEVEALLMRHAAEAAVAQTSEQGDSSKKAKILH